MAGVDVAAGTITITPQDGSAGVTLSVNASTEIEVNGEAALLEAITPGMPIAADYDTVSGLASELEAGADDDGPDDDDGDGDDR